MRISLPEARAFSECPAFYHLQKGAAPSPLHKRTATVIASMKRSYMLAMETGYRVTWRRLMGWVNQEIFSEVDVTNRDAMRASAKLAEHVCTALRPWYHEMYIHEDVHTYIDLDLSAEIEGYEVVDRVDIIQASDPVTVTMFSEVGVNPIKMYNDIVVRGRAWLVARALGCREVSVRLMGIGQRGKLTFEVVKCSTVAQDRFQDNLLQILASIRQGISYPSRTMACDSCPFYRRCRL